VNLFMGEPLLCGGNLVTTKDKAVQHVLEDRIPHAFNLEFTFQEGILSGASSMFVNRNYANLNYQGDERIWFGMQNGDILTRKVSSLTDDEDNDRISLAVATSIDRNLTVSDPYIIGRLLLARFQEDSLIMDFETDKVVSIQVTFYELVNEYP